MTDSEQKPQLDDFDKMDEIASSLKKQMSKLNGSPSYEDEVDEDVYHQSTSKSARVNHSGDLLSTYNLKFVLTGLIGLLIIISILSYFFLGQDKESKQQAIALPENSENSLINNNSKTDSSLYLSPDNNRVKKIPLTYVSSENTNDELSEEKVVEDEITTIDLSKTSNNIKLPAQKVDKTVEISNNQTVVKTAVTPSIKDIYPNIVIGSNSRQKIILKGENFTQSTQVQVSWSSGSSYRSKIFSAKKTASQFSFINDNEIQLRLTTGIKASNWQLLVINKGVKSNQFFFKVTPPFITKKVTAEKVSSKNKVVIKPTQEQTAVSSQTSNNSVSSRSDIISSSLGSNYTVQLTGSSSDSSIKQLIEKYNHVKPLELMVSNRNGSDWYSLLYGSFKSKDEANKAYNKLPSGLKKNKPWIRSVESVQKQMGSIIKPTTSEAKMNTHTAAKKVTAVKLEDGKPRSSQKVVTQKVITKSDELVASEQKILTINPLRWTLQLLSTSSLSSLQQYIKKHKLENKSYFYQKIINGSERFTLIYGAYSSKMNAQFAIEKLPKDIQVAKPWAKKYQDIQNTIRAN